MPRIRRKIISSDIEKKIVTGLIVSDRFCRELLPMLKMDYLQIDYAKTIVGWIRDYFDQYGKAPNRDVQNIFNIERETMKEAEVSLVEGLLSDLSRSYEASDQFNTDYILDQAVAYFENRSLDILARNVSGYLSKGQGELARQEVTDYRKVAKATSVWFNPLREESVKDVFVAEEENMLFRLPGVLGDMIGYFERDWLFAFMGPMKRGKSWYLLELAFQALTARLRVVVVSLEMSKWKVSKRLYSRLTGLPRAEGRFTYPVFDCLWNQQGTCRKVDRTNGVPLFGKGDRVPEFRPGMDYRPCTACRRTRDYFPAVWYEVQSHRRAIDPRLTVRRIEGFKQLFGDNLRIISYPEFSANFNDIVRDLDNLEYTENFVPDVVLIDYFDILAPEDGRLSERGNIDATWKRGKNLAGTRHCFVGTVSQSSRKTFEKKKITPSDTSEDIRKLAHVEGLCSLNQTPEEKARGIMRMQALVKRHDEFDLIGEVMVLQQLSLGQPFLDSEWVKHRRKEEEEK